MDLIAVCLVALLCVCAPGWGEELHVRVNWLCAGIYQHCQWDVTLEENPVESTFV